MTTSRMTRPLFLLVTLAGCATIPSTPVMTNVPSNRLSHEAYMSPDGDTKSPSLT